MRPVMSKAVPEGVQALIRACWERNPANRPATFEEVVLQLDALASMVLAAEPTSELTPRPPDASRV